MSESGFSIVIGTRTLVSGCPEEPCACDWELLLGSVLKALSEVALPRGSGEFGKLKKK